MSTIPDLIQPHWKVIYFHRLRIQTRTTGLECHTGNKLAYLELWTDLISCILFFKVTTHHSVLFTASPKPGVSTMVSLSFTPFSSMSTVFLVISTVWLIRSLGLRKKNKTKTGADIYQCLFHVCIGTVSMRLMTHPLRWAIFCLYADRWGTGCSPEWIYRDQTHLDQTHTDEGGVLFFRRTVTVLKVKIRLTDPRSHRLLIEDSKKLWAHCVGKWNMGQSEKKWNLKVHANVSSSLHLSDLWFSFFWLVIVIIRMSDQLLRCQISAAQTAVPDDVARQHTKRCIWW